MSASEQIDSYLASLPAWQQQNLISFRSLLHTVEPSITEDWKWSTPVFLLSGKLFFAMSAFKAHTKYNFIGNGAVLTDKDKLFNNGLESKKSRSIDLHEGEVIDQTQLEALIREAVTNLL